MTSRLLVAGALVALVAGGALSLADRATWAEAAWAAGGVIVLASVIPPVFLSLARRRIGVDAIALVAMAAALILGEYLAGAVVALMLAGGNALEELAAGRARRELSALVERVPRFARLRRGSEVTEVAVETVVPGDLLLVGAGEILPVDGTIASDAAVLDEAALTGEPLPVAYVRGGAVRSGTANAGGAFELRTLRPAAESAYSGLVRLVEQAQARNAPFVRLADRYAAVFLPVTLAAAGIAWFLSGDAVRALAVLVVATPCPLILAAPIALLAGVSRAARAGIVVKGGGVIEKLGEARTVLLDKTGTITLGSPELAAIATWNGHSEDELLRVAASLDQVSPHALARALVRAARKRGLDLQVPERAYESPGEGVEGVVDGCRAAVGSARWLSARGYGDGRARRESLAGSGRSVALVGIDGRLAGAVVLADRLREDAKALAAELRAGGVRYVALVTGDASEAAETMGHEAGVDRVYRGLSPDQKLEIVRSIQQRPELRPVVMVGDGVNDAPALAAADVGIAMGAGGATVSSETADAVILVDRVDRVVQALAIGRRSFGIARQSVLVGMGLSFAAMIFAALGFIAPVGGALLQEAIDVGVILNALRALR
jgi:heavy metal translocating P-type ATPase